MQGVKKGVVKNTLTVDHYEDCLRNDTMYLAKFNTLRSRKHDITTECVTADNKRIIILQDEIYFTLLRNSAFLHENTGAHHY